MNYQSETVPEQAWKDLALWAARTPRPKAPDLVPGLPRVNFQLMTEYAERLVAWKVGRAEALMYGLPHQDNAPARPLQVGDSVHHKDDPRHLGAIERVDSTSGEQLAKIRWDDHGWFSYRVPVRDLRRSP